MKHHFTLLSVVSLCLTAVSATATATTTAPDLNIVRLPAYRVEAARQTAAERAFAQGLDELRAEARTPVAVHYVPMLPSQTLAPETDARKLVGAQPLAHGAVKS